MYFFFFFECPMKPIKPIIPKPPPTNAFSELMKNAKFFAHSSSQPKKRKILMSSNTKSISTTDTSSSSSKTNNFSLSKGFCNDDFEENGFMVLEPQKDDEFDTDEHRKSHKTPLSSKTVTAVCFIFILFFYFISSFIL
jgi:hypothetical protein